MIDLVLIWGGLISISILLYVLLDGFDLGIGILFPFFKDKKDRDTMVNSVAPVWDGNETWLILGGGGLFAAFPLAYGVLLTAFYAPIIAMLLALIFRGVAFEFRSRHETSHKIWDKAFWLGSTAATFAQGIVLGAFIQGVQVTGRNYSGGWFDWLTPFSIMVGLSLLVAYALLGVCWLLMKTEGELQKDLYRLALPLGVCFVGSIGMISIWTPLAEPLIAQRWFSSPNIFYFAPIPILSAVLAFVFYRAVHNRNEYVPFLSVIGLFVLAFAGLAVSLFPYAVPRAITLWQAANPDKSLSFMLYGVVPLLPIILAYTAHTYWIFKGKVDENDGYH